MGIHRSVEIIPPQKQGGTFTIWFREFRKGQPIGEKYKRSLTKHEYDVWTMTELLLNHYDVPENFLGEYVRRVRALYDDEVKEWASRNTED
jgi:hypothetical protein